MFLAAGANCSSKLQTRLKVLVQSHIEPSDIVLPIALELLSSQSFILDTCYKNMFVMSCSSSSSSKIEW